MNSILFARVTPEPRQPATTTSIFEDFDGDHKADVVTASCVGGLYQIITKVKGRKRAISVSMAGTPSCDIGIVARDIDKDSDKDLLVVNKRTHKILHVLINDGNGAFTTNDSFVVPTYNFAAEITRQNRQNSSDDQFSQNVLSLQLLPDTASFIFSNICGELYCKDIYFNFSRTELLFASKLLAVFSPRSPPLL
jgi:hypothetical protein